MDKIYGIYRGVVVFNSYDGSNGKKTDKELKGRCKVWVAGVMPVEYKSASENLPWSEPAYGLFGANKSGGGENSVPSVGTHVWVFFEEGDYMSPIYFLSCQGGSGWNSEHVKQHTINTEKVSIVVDDNTSNTKSSKKAVLSIDINIKSAKDNDEAVEFNIKGNVVMNINGNVIENIQGNVTKNIQGNVTETVTGSVVRSSTGPYNINGNPVAINTVPQVGS